MPIHLTASAGPLMGRKFTFDRHDIFLLERAKTLHSAIGDKEKYVSRIQFLIELNPPRCRLVDLGNPSGTFVNNKRVTAVELHHRDEIKAGHTYMRVENPEENAELVPFGTLPPASGAAMPAPKSGIRSRMPAIRGYRLESELGRGPLGTVYQAVREADDEIVALKTIVPAIAPTRDQAMAFLNDAAALRELDHPHIVRLHDLGLSDGVFWFATDLVSGTDLGALVKDRGRMDGQIAVRMILQVLSALEYAHENEFGHSDLKLSNVFLEEQSDKKRTVKVADFGVAQAYATSPMSGLTLTGHIGPAVEYIAPEQISHFGEVTVAADQFRAAIALYRLLTDKSPYNPAPPAHPLAHVLDGAVVPLRSRRAELDPELGAVVERALAREPAERYATVKEFAQALLPFAQ